jgi:Transposase domain (DUF772)
MSTTSKSPIQVIKRSLLIANKALPLYSHHMSKRIFTQPQLFTCLVLKQFFKTDYRGLVSILVDSPNLKEAIGLRRVPHWTTLHKALHRLLSEPAIKQLLDESLQLGGTKADDKKKLWLNKLPLMALD